MPAIPGVTTVFTLSATAPTQIAPSNVNRRYFMFQNRDAAINVFLAFATNNGATVNAILIPPNSYYELNMASAVQIGGDVSALAASGSPIVNWTEF